MMISLRVLKVHGCSETMFEFLGTFMGFVASGAMGARREMWVHNVNRGGMDLGAGANKCNQMVLFSKEYKALCAF